MARRAPRRDSVGNSHSILQVLHRLILGWNTSQTSETKKRTEERGEGRPNGEKRLTCMLNPNFLRVAAGMRSCASCRSSMQDWLPRAVSWASCDLRHPSHREIAEQPTSPSVTRMCWPPWGGFGSGNGWCGQRKMWGAVRRSGKRSDVELGIGTVTGMGMGMGGWWWRK